MTKQTTRRQLSFPTEQQNAAYAAARDDLQEGSIETSLIRMEGAFGILRRNGKRVEFTDTFNNLNPLLQNRVVSLYSRALFDQAKHLHREAKESEDDATRKVKNRERKTALVQVMSLGDELEKRGQNFEREPADKAAKKIAQKLRATGLHIKSVAGLQIGGEGSLTTAYSHATQAAELADAIGDGRLRAKALNSMACVHAYTAAQLKARGKNNEAEEATEIADQWFWQAEELDTKNARIKANFAIHSHTQGKPFPAKQQIQMACKLVDDPKPDRLYTLEDVISLDAAYTKIHESQYPWQRRSLDGRVVASVAGSDSDDLAALDSLGHPDSAARRAVREPGGTAPEQHTPEPQLVGRQEVAPVLPPAEEHTPSEQPPEAGGGTREIALVGLSGSSQVINLRDGAYPNLNPKQNIEEIMPSLRRTEGRDNTAADMELVGKIMDWTCRRLDSGGTLVELPVEATERVNVGALAVQKVTIDERRRLLEDLGLSGEQVARSLGEARESKIWFNLYQAYCHYGGYQVDPQMAELFDAGTKKILGVQGPAQGWYWYGDMSVTGDYRISVNTIDPRAVQLIREMVDDGTIRGHFKVGPVKAEGEPGERFSRLMRSDPITIYCAEGTDYRRVAERLRKAIDDKEIATRDGTNLFTHTFARGCSIQQGPGMISFGEYAVGAVMDGETPETFTAEKPNPLESQGPETGRAVDVAAPPGAPARRAAEPPPERPRQEAEAPPLKPALAGWEKAVVGLLVDVRKEKDLPARLVDLINVILRDVRGGSNLCDERMLLADVVDEMDRIPAFAGRRSTLMELAGIDEIVPRHGDSISEGGSKFIHFVGHPWNQPTPDERILVVDSVTQKGYAFQGEIVSEVIVSPKYGSGDQIFHAEYPNAEKFKRRQNEEGTTDSPPATQPAVEDEEKGRVLEGRK